MIKAFSHLSKRKLKKFEMLFSQNINNFDKNTLPDNVYFNIRRDFKTYNAFENGLIMITNQQNLAKDFYTMAWNFKTAAREAAEYMIEGEDVGKLDLVFFSVAYMYRQSLELILKALAFQKITVMQEQIQFVNQVSHDLIMIFEKIEPNLIVEDTDAIDWLKAFLFNVSKVDRASDAFRYPFRIERNPLIKQYEFHYVFKDRKDICLVKLINKFELAFSLINELYNFADGNESANPHLLLSECYKDYSSEFLEVGGDYYAKSVIGHGYNLSEIYVYVQAYTKSADYLYRKALEANNSTDNGLINTFYYPICYLYRNAIELSLKGLCLVSCNHKKAIEIIGENKHNLLKIWNQIKKRYYSNLSFFIPIHLQDEMDKSLTIIATENPSSSKFRYPIDKNMKYFYEQNTRLHLPYDYYHLFHCLNIIDYLYVMTKESIENKYTY